MRTAITTALLLATLSAAAFGVYSEAQVTRMQAAINSEQRHDLRVMGRQGDYRAYRYAHKHGVFAWDAHHQTRF
jgi:hypothetical protein